MAAKIDSSRQRIWGLLKKEFYQIVRDPSSIMIAFILPLILLFLYSTAISLDYNKIDLGFVIESDTESANQLLQSFKDSNYFNLFVDTSREAIEKKIMEGKLRGMVVVSQDFDRDLKAKKIQAPIQVIADGSETNTASVLENYATATIQNWLNEQSLENSSFQQVPINTEFRVWYNPNIDSHYFIMPGSIAIVMTLIGSLLTALVVAREWERGTMEALMATPVSIVEILIGKLVPYFVLGMGTMLLSVMVSLFIVGVPFRGSFLILLGISSLFLIAALSLGLLISTIARNQFIAAQTSIFTAFLPAFILSGYIFPIASMPFVIQLLTYVFPPRYFVSSLKTLFLTGNVPELFLSNAAGIFIIACILIFFIIKTTRKRLD